MFKLSKEKIASVGHLNVYYYCPLAYPLVM